MSPPEVLEFEVPGVGLSFRANLLANKNPDVVRQVLAQLPLQYLMLIGADVMYRFLKISQYEDMALPTLNRMTREFLTGTFNVFEFMTDLGLTNMHRVGQMYSDALDTLTTNDEYVQLTGAMMTYVIRMHRWIHYIFPWNLGAAFPHRKAAEVLSLTKVLASE